MKSFLSYLKEQTPTLPTPPADAMDIAAGNFDTPENYVRELAKYRKELGPYRQMSFSEEEWQEHYTKRLKWAKFHPTQYKREMGIVPGEHFEDPTLHLKKPQSSTLVGTVDGPDPIGQINLIQMIKDNPEHMDIILDLYNQGFWK